MLTNIKGIGDKTEKLFNKLNIYNENDLINYYPFRYNIFRFTNLNNSNDNVMIKATVESNPTVAYIKRNFNRMGFRILYDNKIINVVIFNRAFLKNNIVIGKEITLIGKYDEKKNTLTCSDIKFNIVDGQIEPIYHLTSGLTSSQISKSIQECIKVVKPVDLIPEEYSNEYKFQDKLTSLKNIHFPKNEIDLKQAKIRLIYEELFDFSFKMNYLSQKLKKEKGLPKIYDENKLNEFINSLSFTLTIDQQKSLSEILDDLKSNRKLNRLLLGDVGSGKTIVATIAMYACILSGFQAALMAPTEILAYQHYLSINKLLTPFNVHVGYISGSMTKTQKKKVYDQIENKEIDIVIGTHAILNEDITFANLGLVITDEQHRFGVNQRSVLSGKGNNADVLYLSATPIPRTYAMTIYGDMDISMIKSKPSGRKEIITKVEKESNIKEVLFKMLEQIKEGHQIYVVAPMVDDNNEIDLKSVKLLKEKMDLAFQNKVKCEIIHGKMKQVEKDEIMDSFKNNEIKILISTTVIEVGIDVPNSTMIVIFNAERFGLATLHQLRGRVGRNSLQSYCFLISDYEKERLHVMEESNDGFYISEKDFELRGHGDLFGTKQSGDMSFKIANIQRDYKILVQAKNDVIKYIDSNKYLENIYYKNLSENLNIVD